MVLVARSSLLAKEVNLFNVVLVQLSQVVFHRAS